MPLEGVDVILGKWKLDRNENFDAYLASMGVGYIKRKLAAQFNSTMEIQKVGENKLRIITKGPKDSDHEFPLDEEFEESDPFDNVVKVRVTWDTASKTLTTTAMPVSEKAKKNIVTRSIENDELVMKVTLPDENLVCNRYFKKLTE